MYLKVHCIPVCSDKRVYEYVWVSELELIGVYCCSYTAQFVCTVFLSVWWKTKIIWSYQCAGDRQWFIHLLAWQKASESCKVPGCTVMSQTAALQQMISLSPGSVHHRCRSEQQEKQLPHSGTLSTEIHRNVHCIFVYNKCQRLLFFFFTQSVPIISQNKMTVDSYPSQLISIHPWTLHNINFSSAPTTRDSKCKAAGSCGLEG